MSEGIDPGGVALVHATGEQQAQCSAMNKRTDASGGLHIRVQCYDADKKLVEAPFNVMYTNGQGGGEGKLSTLRVRGSDGKVLQQTGPVWNPTTASVSHEGPGFYRVEMELLSTEPYEDSIQVSSESGENCNIVSTNISATEYNSKEINVQCESKSGSVDSDFSLAYSNGVNVLGSKNEMSDAHAVYRNGHVPPVQQQRDRIYGDASGVVTVASTGTGHYSVTLQHQAVGLTGRGASLVNSVGFASAGDQGDCRQVGQRVQSNGNPGLADVVLDVICTNRLNQYVNSDFALQFVAAQ
ncbi:hypothetical protein [Streptomyces sp. NPDC057909]|uniref:hypothetical protein n=1 Tax=Streptomyces sp. NPDC057909 TaxID=3346277 RepID=UPI0036E9B29F